jgi:hypothetical protein
MEAKVFFIASVCIAFCVAIAGTSCMFRHGCRAFGSRLSCVIKMSVTECPVVRWGGDHDESKPHLTSLLLTERVRTGVTISLDGLPHIQEVFVKIPNRYDNRTLCELFDVQRTITVNKQTCAYQDDVSSLQDILLYIYITARLSEGVRCNSRAKRGIADRAYTKQQLEHAVSTTMPLLTEVHCRDPHC